MLVPVGRITKPKSAVNGREWLQSS